MKMVLGKNGEAMSALMPEAVQFYDDEGNDISHLFGKVTHISVDQEPGELIELTLTMMGVEVEVATLKEHVNVVVEQPAAKEKPTLRRILKPGEFPPIQ